MNYSLAVGVIYFSKNRQNKCTNASNLIELFTVHDPIFTDRITLFRFICFPPIFQKKKKYLSERDRQMFRV